MKAILLLMLAYILPLPIYTQHIGYDNPWLLGHGPNSSDSNGVSLNFIGDSIAISPQSRTMTFMRENASIADSLGNILFYTNGISICNGSHDTIINGKRLCQSSFLDENKSVGMPLPYTLTILPNPGKAGQYYLFHQFIDTDWNVGLIRSYQLLYSLIDMNLNLGKGVVIQKAVPVFQDTFAMMSMAAVKHANGKDWWLTMSGLSNNKVYIFLLDETGVSAPIIQTLGNPTPYDQDISGPTVFSQDGTKLIRAIYTEGFRIYDFDRCTGILSNPLQLPFTLGICGAAVSPSGQFLYHTSSTKVYQYDLWSSDIAASQTLIATYDGYATPPGTAFQTNFFLASLAPNGKIYINSGNGVRCLHVINEPDSLGLACNLVQHGLMFSASNTHIPTPPNYYLGAMVCDTVLSYQSSVNREQVKVYPNPAQDKINIQFSERYAGKTVDLYDAIGRLVQSINLPIYAGIFEWKLENIPNGAYFLRIDGGFSTKLFISH